MALSSFWRSRISFCAPCGSFHSEASSARAFSSSRRRLATSQSKMPPQQGDGLLDLGDGAFDFGAHSTLMSRPAKAGRPGDRCILPEAVLSQIVGDGFFVNWMARFYGP
jgi:hypothetical protein